MNANNDEGKLISGKEALIALANGEEVQCTITGKDEWTKDIYSIQPYYFLGGGVGQFQFRLAPRTITLNGIEVPAPFEPKEGEKYFFINTQLLGTFSGYSDFVMDKDYAPTRKTTAFGAWRTEEEIKQVVAALRQVFGGAV
ncbi:hypothetical protein ABLB95_15335 (plasmid) [Acinetobacter radioresistens]|uniref:hypothetical protein n=1 Tax=Acinetobacter radioresistens TaxID=40216 RepID=UPI0032B3AC8D